MREMEYLLHQNYSRITSCKQPPNLLRLCGQLQKGGGRRGGLLMRGSNCKALPGKVLVFCIGGCSREVVAYLRISHVGVQ